MNFDLIIKNGIVVDGSGNTWYKTDLAIKNGKIGKVGKFKDKSNRIIDANGLIVAPGIIDLHNHSDYSILINPKAESAIRQGITTIFVGNCGFSVAPLTEKSRERIKERTAVLFSGEIDLDWLTYGEYLDTVEKQGTAVNFGGFVGHGTVRTAIIGMDAREATSKEIEDMKELIIQSMDEGAFGFSTGLRTDSNWIGLHLPRSLKILVEG